VVEELFLGRQMDREVARAKFVGERVQELGANVVTPTLVRDADTDEPICIYAPLPEGVADLRRAVRGVTQFNGVNRAGSGYRTKSATFGTAPRKPVFQREGCASTAVKRDFPEQHSVLESYADRCQAMLGEWLPEMVTASADESAAIKPDWRLTPDTFWTSGVINQTVSMPYHTDSSNYDVWSAMPVVRRGTRGGYLHVPEYDVVLECRDGWCAWFPGFRLVHGVTPITRSSPDGYRYSVVFYALRGMRDCATTAMEQQYAKEMRTERERAHARELTERGTDEGHGEG
jgi:hypothetical protein